MKELELAQKYEQLAGRFDTLAEPRRRDHCLVLAADAALSGGRPDEAERLRQALLRANPYHLLCPYGSMSEALQSGDVRDYVADLRRQLPPQRVEQMLTENALRAEGVYDIAQDSRPPTPLEMTPTPEAVSRPPRPAIPPPRKPVAPAPLPTRQTISPVADIGEPPPPPSEQAPGAGRVVATFLFLLGLLLGAAAFFLAFVMPLLD